MPMRLLSTIMSIMMAVVTRVLWCLSLTFFFILYSGSSYAVFSTPAQFSVGGDGSATYNIPLQVPPGSAGMSPKLSLTYSSSGSNGILGMGWGIDGLSQIGRCGKTIIQDGASAGVNYDSNDKLCIDGQRLTSTGGTYGANLTEYRTELANFARIISYGTAGDGPALSNSIQYFPLISVQFFPLFRSAEYGFYDA
jgi:hypothetical protein